MTTISETDDFSWFKFGCLLEETLDSKLTDVAKKEDIAGVKNEIDELRKETTTLKDQIKKLDKRVELIDRKSRQTSLVVRGLNCEDVQSAKKKFCNICDTKLRVDVDVIATRKFINCKSFAFTLQSHSQVRSVLLVKDRVRDQQVFIEKDYTVAEQTNRYYLRSIKRAITNVNDEIRVRLGEYCIFIDHKKYTWNEGKVMATTEEDCEFLTKLFEECSCDFKVDYKKKD